MKYKEFPNGTPLWYSILLEHKIPIRYKILYNKIFRKEIFYKSETFIRKIDENANTRIRHFRYNYRTYYVSAYYSESIPGTYETTIKILPKNKNILELGCGKKNAGKIFKKISKSVHYSDFEKLNIDCFTKANYNNKLPFKKNEFDYAIALDVIEHLENPYLFLRELNRISREGFIISSPNLMSYENKIKFQKTNFFNWFEPKNHQYHILPIFPWQISTFCKKNKLKLKIYGNFSFFNCNCKIYESESLIYSIMK